MEKVVRIKPNPHFYDLFWDWDFDILLCVGSYGSGKSYEMFTKLAYICSVEDHRVCVVREVHGTHKDSTYTDLEEAFERVGTVDQFEFMGGNSGKLLITHKTNKKRVTNKKSELIFRGADKRTKIKGIKGFDIIIVEEANQLKLHILKELVGRLRSNEKKVRLMLMTNPGLDNDSIGQLFFNEWGFNFDELYEKRTLEDTREIDVIRSGGVKEKSEIKIKLHHSTYKDNEHNSAMFVWNLENEQDPDIIKIAREGRYGITEGIMFKNVTKKENVWSYLQEQAQKGKKYEMFNGLDFGHSVSVDCPVKLAVDRQEKKLYIYDGFYESGLGRDELAEKLKKLLGREYIACDTNESRMRTDLKKAGIRVTPAKKGAGSVAVGLSILRGFREIIIDSTLDIKTKDGRNIYQDMKNFARVKKPDGTFFEDKFNIDCHPSDSCRYALEGFSLVDGWQRIAPKPRGF